MTSVKVPTLILIICACVTSTPSSPQKGFSHGANHKILETIDAVFITLKINENFTKSKNIADYLSMHNFVQDAVQKNDLIFQRIRSKCKTKFSNKTASLNSNIDEVIEETINKQKAKISENFRNYDDRNNTAWIYDEIRNSFLKLTKDFQLEINTLPNNIKLLASDINNIGPESRRIFMGKPTTISRFPFVVSIHVQGRFSCVGALIQDDLVITAASCFLQFISVSPRVRVTFIKVRVGSDFTNKQGQLLPVASLHLHPAFNTNVLSHNLALVHLEQQRKWRRNANASIKFDRIAQEMPTYVQSVVILGWGEKGSSKNVRNKKNIVSDPKLVLSRLELYDADECENIYTRSYVSGKLFCAGSVEQGSGACQNDVGAPAIVGNTLVGVTSFGAPRCGQHDAPTVFTKIGFYTAWIDGIYNKIHKKDPNPAAYNLNLKHQRVSIGDEKPKELYLEDFRENDNSPKQTEFHGYNDDKTKDQALVEPVTDLNYGKFVFDITSSTIPTRISRGGSKFTIINESPPHYSSEEKKEKEVVYVVPEDQIFKYYREGHGDKAGEGHSDKAGEKHGDKAGEAHGDKAGEGHGDKAGKGHGDTAEVAIRESGTTRRYVLDKKIPKIQRALEKFKKLFARYML